MVSHVEHLDAEFARGQAHGNQQIEQEIQSKGLTAPRVTPDDIEVNIASEHYFSALDGVMSQGGSGFQHILPPIGPDPAVSLGLLTFCVLVLKNGFTVVGKSACASPENFDAELGRKYAREKAIDNCWDVMGYELKSKLAAVPVDFRDRVRAEESELQDRIDKLAAFLPTDTFSKLPKDEQDRLTAQLAAMQDYSNCLAERVAAFGGLVD